MRNTVEGQLEWGTARRCPGRAGKKPVRGAPEARIEGWLKLRTVAEETGMLTESQHAGR